MGARVAPARPSRAEDQGAAGLRNEGTPMSLDTGAPPTDQPKDPQQPPGLSGAGWSAIGKGGADLLQHPTETLGGALFGPLTWYSRNVADVIPGALGLTMQAVRERIDPNVHYKASQWARSEIARLDAEQNPEHNPLKTAQITLAVSAAAWEKVGDQGKPDAQTGLSEDKIGPLGTKGIADVANPAWGGLGKAGELTALSLRAAGLGRLAPVAEQYVRSAGLAGSEWVVRQALSGAFAGAKNLTHTPDLFRDAGRVAAEHLGLPGKVAEGTLRTVADAMEAARDTFPTAAGLSSVSRGVSHLFEPSPVTRLRLEMGRTLDDAMIDLRAYAGQTGQELKDLVGQHIENPEAKGTLAFLADLPPKSAQTIADLFAAIRNRPAAQEAWQREMLRHPYHATENFIRDAMVDMLDTEASRLGVSGERIANRARYQESSGADAKATELAVVPPSRIGKVVNDAMAVWYAGTLGTPGFMVHVAFDTFLRAGISGVNPFMRVGPGAGARYAQRFFTDFPEYAGMADRLASRNPFKGAKEKRLGYEGTAQQEAMGAGVELIADALVGTDVRQAGEKLAGEKGKSFGSSLLSSRANFPSVVRAHTAAVRENTEARFAYELASRMYRQHESKAAVAGDAVASKLQGLRTRASSLPGPVADFFNDALDHATSRADLLQARSAYLKKGGMDFAAAVRSDAAADITSGLPSGLTEEGDRRLQAAVQHGDVTEIERSRRYMTSWSVLGRHADATQTARDAAAKEALARVAGTDTPAGRMATRVTERLDRPSRVGAPLSETEVGARAARRDEQISARREDFERQERSEMARLGAVLTDRLGKMPKQDAWQAWDVLDGLLTERERDGDVTARAVDSLREYTLRAAKSRDANRVKVLAEMRAKLPPEDFAGLGPGDPGIARLWDNYIDRADTRWSDHFTTSVTRTQEKADELLGKGAYKAESPAAAAKTNMRAAEPGAAGQQVPAAQAAAKPGEQAPAAAADASASAKVPVAPKAADADPFAIEGDQSRASGAVLDELFQRAAGPSRTQVMSAWREQVNAWHDRARQIVEDDGVRSRIDETTEHLYQLMSDAAEAVGSRPAEEAKAWLADRSKIRETVRAEKDKTFVDYERRTNADRYMTMAFPFWQFASRNPMTWGHILVSHPQWAMKYGQYRENPDSFYVPIGDTGFSFNPIAPMSGWKFIRQHTDDPMQTPVQRALDAARQWGFNPGPLAMTPLLMADHVARQAGGDDAGFLADEQEPVLPGVAGVRDASAAMGANKGRGVDLTNFGNPSARTGSTDERRERLAGKIGAAEIGKPWEQLSSEEQTKFRTQAAQRMGLRDFTTAISYSEPTYQKYLAEEDKLARSLGVTPEEAKALQAQNLGPLSSPKVSPTDLANFYEAHPEYRNLPSQRAGRAGDSIRSAQNYHAEVDKVYLGVHGGYTDRFGQQQPGLDVFDQLLEAGKIDRHTYEMHRSKIYDEASGRIAQLRQQTLEATGGLAPIDVESRKAFAQRFGGQPAELNPIAEALGRYREVGLHTNPQTGDPDYQAFDRDRLAILGEIRQSLGEKAAKEVATMYDKSKSTTERRLDWRMSLARGYEVAGDAAYVSKTYLPKLQEIDAAYRTLDELRHAHVPARDPRYAKQYEKVRSVKDELSARATKINDAQVQGYEGAEWSSWTPTEKLDHLIGWISLPAAYMTKWQRDLIGRLSPENRGAALNEARTRRAQAGQAPVAVN